VSVELPKGIPERGQRAEVLLAWATLALDREHNPIVFVRRYGFGLDARLELVMNNGDEVRVHQRELMGANGLRHVMLAYDGTVIPGYDQPRCATVVARLIWASEASVQDDETETLVDDLAGFLNRTLPSGVVRGRYDDQDGYRLVADFVTANRRAGCPVLGVNQATTPDTVWVSRAALIAYLRETCGKAHPPDVRSSLEKVGWEWQDLQRRNPHDAVRKPRARVYVLRADWDRCPFDLGAELEKAPRVNVPRTAQEVGS
jgi:hypothetical protein